MSRFQKGQSIVEFAIVLPFFFLLLWGFAYFGMFFSDYLMLNNTAREYARQASLQQESQFKDLQGKLQDTCENNQITHLFVLNKNKTKIEQDPKNQANVLVTIHETIDTKHQSGLVKVFRSFLNDAVSDGFNIEYRMYWEGKGSAS